MEWNFAEKVSILGTDYKIEITEKDAGFNGHPGAYGFTDYNMKRIVLKDKRNYPVYKDDQFAQECMYTTMKKVLRHEIVHAFLGESGLYGSTLQCTSWAKNEEMVDWIALQGPKMIKAWEEAGAL